MQKIAIIGGGIIGMTLANYLDPKKYQVTLFDDPTGQATKASAGIISPWLSKRRNKQWYRLAKDGAAFFPKLIQDFQLDHTIYQQSGTLLLRPEKQIAELRALAEERKKKRTRDRYDQAADWRTDTARITLTKTLASS